VVETVRFDPVTKTAVILSGWGEYSDWVLNIQQTPGITMQVGQRRWPATAMRLRPEDAAKELVDYTHRRPVVLPALARRYHIAASAGARSSDICRELADRIPLFALRPRSG